MFRQATCICPVIRQACSRVRSASCPPRMAAVGCPTSPCRNFFGPRRDPFFTIVAGMDRVSREMQREMDEAWREFDRRSPDIARGPVGAVYRSMMGRNVPVEPVNKDGVEMYTEEFFLDGYTAKDVKVVIQGREVKIDARKEESRDGFKSVREYSNTFKLPDEVDPEAVRSLFHPDGRLVIEAPIIRPQEEKQQSSQEAEPEEIPIQKQDPKK